MAANATGYVKDKLNELEQARQAERDARRRVTELQALVKQLLASNEITDADDEKRARRLTRPPRASHGAATRKTGAHR
jgi:hypothetical protein